MCVCVCMSVCLCMFSLVCVCMSQLLSLTVLEAKLDRASTTGTDVFVVTETFGGTPVHPSS